MDNRTRAWIRAIRGEIDHLNNVNDITKADWAKLVDEYDPRKPKEP